MPSRRNQIGLTPSELSHFLDERSILVLATQGRDGRPHLTALWYVVRDGNPWIFTYARSQKVRNLQRTPQATLMIEGGHEYSELRGAVFYADAVIHSDLDVVTSVGEELIERYGARGRDGGSGLDEPTRAAVRARAAKRLAIEFRPTRVISWDHAKLHGTY